MNIYQPVISGSLTVTGSTTFFGNITINSGSLTMTSGSLTGTASFSTSASYAYTASSATSASYVLNAVSSSYAFTASSATNSTSASKAVSSSYSDTASFSNNFTVLGNLTVYGTQSVQYITSSQLNVANNIINVNVGTPGVRFGGLSVFDSGSTAGATGSLFWDSQNNNWVYQQVTGSTYTGGMLISGPRNTGGLGNEQGTTSGSLMKGQGGDHVTSSAIFEDGYKATFYGTSLVVSSSGLVGIGSTSPSTTLDVSGSGRFTGTLNIGNDVTNSSLVFKTGGSTSYSATISTNSNVDQFNILGGSTAGYDNGSSIGLVGADRYGTKTAGMLTLSAGNAVNNTAYGYISMNTGNTERLKITYAGNIGIGITNPDANLVIGNLNTAGKGSINGASGTINRLIVNCPYPGAPALTLAYYSSAYGLDLWVNGDGTGLAPIYFDQRQTEAIIFRRSTYGTAAESMRITGGGYVGIGTTSPTNTLQVKGNVRFGNTVNNGMLRSTYTQISSTSTTADIFRFLDNDGNVLGGGFICGHLYINALDTSTGGNQSQYIYTVLSSGNGTSQLAFTYVSSNTRGTNPVAAGGINAVADGGGGQIKIQLTTAASGIAGANVYCTFVGQL